MIELAAMSHSKLFTCSSQEREQCKFNQVLLKSEELKEMDCRAIDRLTLSNGEKVEAPRKEQARKMLLRIKQEVNLLIEYASLNRQTL